MKVLFTIPDRIHGYGPISYTWQRDSGNYLATTGINHCVNIYDRHGNLVSEISLPGLCTGLVWDRDGDVLAIINNRTNVVFLWNATTQKTDQLDSSIGLKDSLSFAAWAKKSQILAIGNTKGNLLLYNHQTSRKIPIIGKHTKKITCGAFNDEGILALGSDDSTISVSNQDGDSTYSFATNGEPSNIQFADMKESERLPEGESTISAITGNSTLMLINLANPEAPTNLQFQQHYGNMIDYAWFGDGYLLIGFSEGYVVSVSTHEKEIGMEIFSHQYFKSSLCSLLVSEVFGKAVCCGDTNVKLLELHQLKEVYAILPIENAEKGLDKINMSDDAQLLAVSTKTGALTVFLTQLPSLGDAYKTRIAILTSLSEVTVSNEVNGEKPVTFAVDVEPSIIGVGSEHSAVGMNNRAWFYKVREDGVELVRDREYLGTVEVVKLNQEFACVMFDGKVELHSIEASESEEKESKLFPDSNKITAQITCVAVTSEFLIFGTNAGHISYFYFDDWKSVNEFRHAVAIKALYPDSSGTRLIIIDSKQEGYVYNPLNDSLLAIKDWPNNIKAVLWDNLAQEKDTFVVVTSDKVFTFVCYRDTLEGPKTQFVGATKLPHDQSPLILYNGTVTCQARSGRLNSVPLETHVFEGRNSDKSPSEIETILKRTIGLRRWHNCWALCDQSSNKDHWKALGKAAIYHLDIDFAIRVYRQIMDVGMVWGLESVRNTEDRNEMAGHLAMFIELFDQAESLYLNSSVPVLALEMRRDLLHWDKALQLAARFAPNEIPFISKEFAQQLEITGDYTNALLHFEKGIVKENVADFKDHNDSCKAGIARMSIRLGDIRRGTSMAAESGNKSLLRDCASILESMKQYNEAAELYEKGEFFDRAAAVCVRSKNWSKVGELLPKVHSPKIHIQFAKAMEAEKKYKPAVEAYKRAKDYDNVVRVMLDHLNSPEEAVRIVRESKSVEGAKLVAKFFLKLNDYSSAIQFLVLSQCPQDAYKLAQQHNKMEIYAEVLGDEGSQEDYENMAQFFQTRHNFKLAGKFYYMAGNYARALDHLISNGEDHDSLKLAIQCVGAAGDGDLTRKLVDFLMGEIDGIPKDAKYLFRLYMALQMHREAAKVAVIIAREEQKNGQYRVAHDVLFTMFTELRDNNIKIASDMDNSLMLIHSYLIAKIHIKKGNHLIGARLLIRVSSNISKFPSHAVPILTSTVIECQRSGLKGSAFRFASELISDPDKRRVIDEKYKKKIETIVRKPDKSEIPDVTTPCPFCDSDLPQFDLKCSSCMNSVPYCIATGKHVLKDDFTKCSNCRSPAIYSEFLKVLDSEVNCPMCGKKIDHTSLELVQFDLSDRDTEKEDSEKENKENEIE